MEASEDEHKPNGADTVDDNPAVILDDLLKRANVLIDELKVFETRLHKYRQHGTFAFSHFRAAVQSECSVLDRGLARLEDEFSSQVARGSNLPFLEHLWWTAKKSKDVVALQKQVYLHSSGLDLVSRVQRLDFGNSDRRPDAQSRKEAVRIDVISDGGKTWHKVSLVTNNRLIFDLAKQGWDSDVSDDDDDADSRSSFENEAENRDVPLVKTAKSLVKAASRSRVLTKHPVVQFVLPRIERGKMAEIDKILNAIEACGAHVTCKGDWQPPPPLLEALPFMVRDPVLQLSETLNIDCTILLALVSDISHAEVPEERSLPPDLQRQVDSEDESTLLPSILYPILGGRALVSTKEAAQRMREIVETMATPSERARTALLLGDGPSRTPEELVKELQQFSAYPVPAELRLPINTVVYNPQEAHLRLGAEAFGISERLTAINKSVFMHGWATGQTTITSNRAAVKQLEHEIEKLEDVEDDRLPSIWVCSTSRSLAGKERRGQKNAAHPKLDGHSAPGLACKESKGVHAAQITEEV